MLIKELLKGEEARGILFKGIEDASRMITATMGVGGRNIMFEDLQGRLRLTKDGVTVAKNIMFLENPVEEYGVRLLRKASVGTSEEAGDGTTTSTLLAYSLMKEALTHINSDNKINAVELKKGIDKASKQVLNYLNTLKIELTEDTAKEMLRKVGTLSANGDVSIGNLISTAVLESGKDGLIQITKGKYPEDRIEVVEGVEFKKGLQSELFVTEEQLGICKLIDPYILVVDTNFDTPESIKALYTNIMNPVAQTGKSLLIIVDTTSDLALQQIIRTKMQGVFKVCIVDAPMNGENKTKFLQDIAVLTGATFISPTTGTSISNATLESLGRAGEAVIKKSSTIIIDAKGDKTAVDNRIKMINYEIQQAESIFEKTRLQERKSNLLGGIHLINIGGLTDVEIGERFDRADDALRACKCTLEEGVLAGGGTSLLRASSNVNFEDTTIFTNKHQLIGAEIVRKAIKEPFFKILDNAGIDKDDIYMNMGIIKNDTTNWLVYNPLENIFVDGLEGGIIDPYKVTRCALENAVSVCGSLITTGGVIYTKRDDSEFGTQFEQVVDRT